MPSPRYAMLNLRRESFCKATYLWPYKPVTRNLRKLMSEKMPVKAGRHLPQMVFLMAFFGMVSEIVTRNQRLES